VRQSPLNLGHLKTDKGSICVTNGEVRDQNLTGLLPAAMGDEPSGRFWEEVNANQLKCRESSLEKGGDPPTPCCVELERSECTPCSDNTAKVKGRVLQSSELASVSRIGKFGNENRTRLSQETGTETEDGSGGNEGFEIL
jgi:hypothetical protein